MKIERWWQNGVLVRETRDGVEVNLDPTLTQKASNLIGAGGRMLGALAKGAQVAVSDAERQRRMTICAGCEFYTGKTCRKCGCHIRFKAKLQTEHCPIDKW